MPLRNRRTARPALATMQAADRVMFEALDAAGQFSGVDIERVLVRVERNFHNEVAERGGDQVALRRVCRWLAGVEYREWMLLAEDRKNLLAEVERLGQAVYDLQGPM